MYDLPQAIVCSLIYLMYLTYKREHIMFLVNAHHRKEDSARILGALSGR
jgi:hypothetical protein